MAALLAPILVTLGLLLILAGGLTARADSSLPPSCQDLLVGPPKQADAQNTVDAVTVNADHSVTMTVTVSWSHPISAKVGEHVFDCVWVGQPGDSAPVGSTGHPGVDCSSPGLPCRFTVDTMPLSSGTQTLCDIAKFMGFWPKEGTGPSPSGSRTPAECKTVEIPPPPPPPPSPPAQTAQSEAATTTPGLPATGLPATGAEQANGLAPTGAEPVNRLALFDIAAGGLLIVVGLGLAAHLVRSRA